jgi:glyoxylase-like metal-dependent hydrolase (beta-lactamase superfamily II)
MPTTPFLSTQGVISFLITNSQNEAILIDPSFDMAQKIVLEIKQKGLKLKYILDTHTHADFFSSRALFKALYPEAKVGLSEFSPTKDNELKLKDNDILELSQIKLTVWQANGHTNESLVFVLEQDSQTSIFTGDTLFVGGTGRTDFQIGDSQILYQSLERILTLPDTTIIYPGHNYQGQTKTTLAVEKLTNLRLKLVLEGKNEEFVTLMNNHKPTKPDIFEESLRWNSI